MTSSSSGVCGARPRILGARRSAMSRLAISTAKKNTVKTSPGPRVAMVHRLGEQSVGLHPRAGTARGIEQDVLLVVEQALRCFERVADERVQHRVARAAQTVAGGQGGCVLVLVSRRARVDVGDVG